MTYWILIPIIYVSLTILPLRFGINDPLNNFNYDSNTSAKVSKLQGSQRQRQKRRTNGSTFFAALGDDININSNDDDDNEERERERARNDNNVYIIEFEIKTRCTINGIKIRLRVDIFKLIVICIVCILSFVSILCLRLILPDKESNIVILVELLFVIIILITLIGILSQKKDRLTNIVKLCWVIIPILGMLCMFFNCVCNLLDFFVVF